MFRLLLYRAGHFLLGREAWLLFVANLNLKRMSGKKYERAFRHFTTMLPSAGLVLDIGANLGVMSAYMAKKNAAWKIIAVEPIPLHVKVMKRFFVQQHIKTIAIIEKAVSDKPGKMQMQVPVANGMVQHGLASVTLHQLANTAEKYEVATLTIDALMEMYGTEQLAGIKIDVENHEWEVLNGALQTIRKYKPVLLVELWNDAKKKKCIELMLSLQYNIMVLNHSKTLVPYTGQDVLDYFFIPKEVK